MGKIFVEEEDLPEAIRILNSFRVVNKVDNQKRIQVPEAHMEYACEFLDEGNIPFDVIMY